MASRGSLIFPPANFASQLVLKPAPKAMESNVMDLPRLRTLARRASISLSSIMDATYSTPHMAAQDAVHGVPHKAQSSDMGYDDLGRRESSVEVLARNLVLLKDRTGIDYKTASDRSGGGASVRSIHRAKKRGNTSLETLDALARGFGLQSGRDLLNPNLGAALDYGEWLDRAARVLADGADASELLKNAIRLAESSIPKR